VLDRTNAAMVDQFAGGRLVVAVRCPGLGCGGTARQQPDGRTVCERTGWVYGPDGRSVRDPDLGPASELTDEDRALCAEEARMKRLEDV
jgi:hypothetical protein